MIAEGDPKAKFLEAAFHGERVDFYFQQELKTGVDQAFFERTVATTSRGGYGPDVVSKVTGTWYDVTTQGAWRAHELLYSQDFGALGRLLAH